MSPRLTTATAVVWTASGALAVALLGDVYSCGLLLSWVYTTTLVVAALVLVILDAVSPAAAEAPPVGPLVGQERPPATPTPALRTHDPRSLESPTARDRRLGAS